MVWGDCRFSHNLYHRPCVQEPRLQLIVKVQFEFMQFGKLGVLRKEELLSQLAGTRNGARARSYRPACSLCFWYEALLNRPGFRGGCLV